MNSASSRLLRWLLVSTATRRARRASSASGTGGVMGNEDTMVAGIPAALCFAQWTRKLEVEGGMCAGDAGAQSVGGRRALSQGDAAREAESGGARRASRVG